MFHTMKKEIIKFKVDRAKQRAHKALFDNDLPFGHKVVNPKNNYKRRPKHRTVVWDDAYEG